MKSTTDMQIDKSKTKQRQMPFQMHISSIFGEVISRHGVTPDSQQLKAPPNEDATSKNKNESPSIPWNN